MWTASTIKLAMVADLLTRERAGALRLGDADRGSWSRCCDIRQRGSRHVWSRYGGTAPAFNAELPALRHAEVRPQPGFGDVFPYWGFQKATADDFDGLMNYV